MAKRITKGKGTKVNQENQAATVVVQPQAAPVPNIDVMAYRLEQNELATRELKKAISDEFKEVSKQIADLGNNFATKEQLHDTETDINTAITTVSNRVKVLEDDKQAVLKKISVTFASALVLMVLAQYGLNQFFK